MKKVDSMHASLLVGCIVVGISIVAYGSPPVQEGKNMVSEQSSDGEIVGWRSFHETEGTKTPDVWQLQTDGILVCKGQPKGYLYTMKDDRDVVMSFEWRWPEGKPGKGGVLLRMTGEDKIWPKSLEVQLNHGDAGDYWGLAGFALEGPAARMKTIDHEQFGRLTNVKHTEDLEKPVGQWNACRIVLKGDTVRVWVNGQCVNQAQHCAMNPGKILLTSEGSEIHFRNLRMFDAE